MGYEIVFHYYDRENEGQDFDKDESKLKNRTVIIGQAGELVPIEKVAATIMKEFTKRNVWIEKVEVSEWVKKPLKFAETRSGGIKLGAQSFNLGLNEIMKWAVDDSPAIPQAPPSQQLYIPQQQAPQQQLYLPQQQNPQQQVNFGQPSQRKVWPHEQQFQQRAAAPASRDDFSQAVQSGTYATTSEQAYPTDPNVEPKLRLQNQVSLAGLRYAQRVELCDPPPELRRDVSQFALTPGKKYQILEEKLAQDQRNYMYKVMNDQGREIIVGWHYFRQPQAIREEVSYYDQHGNLRTVATYVDQASSQANQDRRPRLLYDNEPTSRTGVQTSADPRMNNLLSRMDAAVQRRTGVSR